MFFHLLVQISGPVIIENACFVTATPPPTAEYDEKQQETPMVEVHEDEAVTSIPSFPEPHENETARSVTEPLEFEETGIVSPQSPPPVALDTAESAISDEATTEVQDSEPSTPVPANLSIHVQGKTFGFILNILTKCNVQKSKSVNLQMRLKSRNNFFIRKEKEKGFLLIVFFFLFWKNQRFFSP